VRRRESEQAGLPCRGGRRLLHLFDMMFVLSKIMKRAAGVLPPKEKSLHGARLESFAFERSDKMLVLLLLALGAREINLS
jgi:hypothetical protein